MLGQTRGFSEPSAMDATFKADFVAWKKQRPAWSAMVAAIKADSSNGEIDGLAFQAGASFNETADLKLLRKRAIAGGGHAAELPAIRKKIKGIEAEIAAMEKKLAAAGAAEFLEISEDIEAAKSRRMFIEQTELPQATQAASTIAAAKQAGVL